MKKHIAAYTLIAAIILLLSFGWCSEYKGRNSDNDKMRSAWANDTVRLIKLAAQKDSITRYEMEQKLGSYKDAAVVAGDEAKKYKSLLAVVRAKVGVRKDSIIVKYIKGDIKHDTLAIYDTTCIPVGTAFAYNDKWFYIGGTLGAENVLIDSTGFYPGTMKVIIGNKKGGLFKRQQPTISLMFENPNMYAHTANNIIVQDKRKPKRLLWFLAGAAAGFVGGVLTH